MVPLACGRPPAYSFHYLSSLASISEAVLPLLPMKWVARFRARSGSIFAPRYSLLHVLLVILFVGRRR